jgi:hypothetical protein
MILLSVLLFLVYCLIYFVFSISPYTQILAPPLPVAGSPLGKGIAGAAAGAPYVGEEHRGGAEVTRVGCWRSSPRRASSLDQIWAMQTFGSHLDSQDLKSPDQVKADRLGERRCRALPGRRRRADPMLVAGTDRLPLQVPRAPPHDRPC